LTQVASSNAALVQDADEPRAELLALQRSDIDDATGMVIISKSLEQLKCGHLRVKSTKSGEPRGFAIPEWASEAKTRAENWKCDKQ
jgi:hypothetical protein